MIKLAAHFTEVRLVFDRYINDSLKAGTRRKRTSGKEVRYQISDSTKITSIQLKTLLSHIDTKQDLTVYLARKSITALEQIRKNYVVTYDKVRETNLEEFPEYISTHDHEEADTLLILHCWDAARKDPFTMCTVFTPDTDVFLLLVRFYPSLTQSLVFRTGRGNELRDIDVRSCYEAIGTDHAKALLAFHTFTGCNQTGRFCGKSKTVWWKEFRKADESTLNALAKLGKTQNVHCISCKFYSV